MIRRKRKRKMLPLARPRMSCRGHAAASRAGLRPERSRRRAGCAK